MTTTLISKAIDAFARDGEKPFDGDRANTVGASEIGQCARKIFWIKNENDPVLAVGRDPEYQETWGARMRGSIYESKVWVPAMRKRFGKRLKYAGRSQKTFVHNFLSATPDGVVDPLTARDMAELGIASNCITIECKTADPRSNLTEAKSENVYQTHVQMGILRATTQHQPTHAVLSYANASFWNEVTEFVVAYDHSVYEAAQARAQLIMTAVSVDETKPEGWIAGGAECRYCPFTRACGVQRRNLPFAEDDAPVDPQFAAEITDLARELKHAEQERDDGDSHAREVQQKIKDRLREKQIRKIPGVVTWSTVKGRTTIDNKGVQAAAVAAGIDLAPYTSIGEPTDRLVVTVGADKP